MAHYAFLDSENIVTEVITGRNEDEVVDGISDWEAHYGAFRGQTCKRTSYNNNYRKNYAGIGFHFREDLNAPDGAFVAPQPFASWILNEDTCRWEAPVAMPEDGKFYQWDEETTAWVEIPTE
jgi:hypothetical protein